MQPKQFVREATGFVREYGAVDTLLFRVGLCLRAGLHDHAVPLVLRQHARREPHRDAPRRRHPVRLPDAHLHGHRRPHAEDWERLRLDRAHTQPVHRLRVGPDLRPRRLHCRLHRGRHGPACRSLSRPSSPSTASSEAPPRSPTSGASSGARRGRSRSRSC